MSGVLQLPDLGLEARPARDEESGVPADQYEHDRQGDEQPGQVAHDGSAIPVRRIYNVHLGWFWTRDYQPVIPSRHPPMTPPGSDDWR